MNTATATEVRTIQDRFDQAELHDDRDALHDLIDDEFLSIGPKGFVLDKEQWINRHNFFTYHTLDISEIDVRVFGQTVIVRDIQRNRATSSGREVQISTRVSQVWTYRDRRWRLIAIQFSPLAENEPQRL